MSKKWQYASLGEGERLDLIKSGNNEVYSSEKERNSTLRSLKSSLGLSTEDVDTWDDMVEDARRQYSSGKLLSKKDVDEITGTREQSASYLLNSELGTLRDALSASKNAAVNDAQKALGDAAEWLASNGYSAGGNTARKTKSEIENELINTLRILEAEYKNKSAKALASAVSKYM